MSAKVKKQQAGHFPPEALVCEIDNECVKEIVEIVDVYPCDCEDCNGRPNFVVVDIDGFTCSTSNERLIPLTKAAQVFLRKRKRNGYPPDALVCMWQSLLVVEIVDILDRYMESRDVFILVDKRGLLFPCQRGWLSALTPAARVFLREVNR